MYPHPAQQFKNKELTTFSFAHQHTPSFVIWNERTVYSDFGIHLDVKYFLHLFAFYMSSEKCLLRFVFQKGLNFAAY
jgi:hypothetical protein